MTAANWLQHWVRTPIADALGWTLLHSLWEGAAMALLLAMTLALTRSARLRYAASSVALLAMLVSFAATLWHLWPEPAGIRIPIRLTLPPPPPVLSFTSGAQPRTFTEIISFIAPWLAPLWILGVCLFSIRSAIGWVRLSNLRGRGVCSAPAVWQSAVTWLSTELRLSRAVVLTGWRTGRGRIYIQYGPPDEIESHPRADNKLGAPYEEWLYHHIVSADGKLEAHMTLAEGKKPDTYSAAAFTFVDKTGAKDYTLENTVLIGKQAK